MTAKTPDQLKAEVLSSFPDNTSGLITPAVMRSFQDDIIDSYHNIGGGTFLATDNFSGDITTASLVALIGSQAVPDSTHNPVVVIQKQSSETVIGNNQSLYVSGIKYSDESNAFITSAFFESQDNVGWNGIGVNNFVEGLRSQGTLQAATLLGSAYGVVGAAGEGTGATHTYLTGIEGEVDVFSANATSVFDQASYTASFVASSRGSKQPDVAFTVNPFTATGSEFRYGYYVPRGNNPVVIDASFYSDVRSPVWGLVVRWASFGAIGIPNNAPIRGKNAATSADLNIINLNASDALELGIEATGIIAAKTIQPAANDGAALGLPTVSFSDLFLASGGVINWNNGNVTITHSAGSLAFVGASVLNIATGADNSILLTRTDATAYSEVNFQTSQYVRGGASADPNMYINVPTAGVIAFGVNTTLTNYFTATGLSVLPNLAIPAGGSAGNGIGFSSTANFGIYFGSGVPSLSAAKGSLYLRSDGTATNDRAFINTNGSTTWTALTTVA